MPPSGDVGATAAVERLYPDLTQFYFSEGLEFGPQEDHQMEPTSPYSTLLRPDYPLYPELTELNITEEEVHEIAPDYPTDNTNEEAELVSARTDHSGSTRDTRYTVRVNLNKLEKKVLNDKTIEFIPRSLHLKEQHDFQSWMKWRTQVNRQLVAMILIKHGRRVLMRPSEMERKPLSTSTIRSVIDNAHSSHKNWTTALPGKPYVMYGIPRVQLSTHTRQIVM